MLTAHGRKANCFSLRPMLREARRNAFRSARLGSEDASHEPRSPGLGFSRQETLSVRAGRPPFRLALWRSAGGGNLGPTVRTEAAASYRSRRQSAYFRTRPSLSEPYAADIWNALRRLRVDLSFRSGPQN